MSGKNKPNTEDTQLLQEDKQTTNDENRIQRYRFRQYIKNLHTFIVTTRFNDATWLENMAYRERHNIKCIYCSPETTANFIPADGIMFVLEMNNDTNRIMGIGMVKNHPICNKHRVYRNGNYNRYVYTSKYRIDRTEMTEMEEKIMQAFDILCFTGNSHMKRGQGFKAFPMIMLFRCLEVIDLVKFVSEMFKNRVDSGCAKNRVDSGCAKNRVDSGCAKNRVDSGCAKNRVDSNRTYANNPISVPLKNRNTYSLHQ